MTQRNAAHIARRGTSPRRLTDHELTQMAVRGYRWRAPYKRTHHNGTRIWVKGQWLFGGRKV